MNRARDIRSDIPSRCVVVSQDGASEFNTESQNRTNVYLIGSVVSTDEQPKTKSAKRRGRGKRSRKKRNATATATAVAYAAARAASPNGARVGRSVKFSNFFFRMPGQTQSIDPISLPRC